MIDMYWVIDDSATLCVEVVGAAINDPSIKVRVVSQTATEVVLEATEKVQNVPHMAIGYPNFRPVKLLEPLGDRVVTTHQYGVLPQIPPPSELPHGAELCQIPV